MRFDEYAEKHGVSVLPVDRFAGLAVRVGVPSGWEAVDVATGVRVWVRRRDPHVAEFCPNAVLTMHRVQPSLDAVELFAMLVDQQLHSVPGCRESYRNVVGVANGVGVEGSLATQFDYEAGPIDSLCRSRIITTEENTLIAQLTVTALRDSPEAREKIWLYVGVDAVEDRALAHRNAERSSPRGDAGVHGD